MESENDKIINLVKEIDQDNENGAKLNEGLVFYQDFSLFNIRELGIEEEENIKLIDEYEFSILISNYTELYSE